jgi:hypothetical protein
MNAVIQIALLNSRFTLGARGVGGGAAARPAVHYLNEFY